MKCKGEVPNYLMNTFIIIALATSHNNENPKLSVHDAISYSPNEIYLYEKTHGDNDSFHGPYRQ